MMKGKIYGVIGFVLRLLILGGAFKIFFIKITFASVIVVALLFVLHFMLAESYGRWLEENAKQLQELDEGLEDE